MCSEWLGEAQDQAHWRESHYQVEGPVVAQMQAVFIDNWIKATGWVLHGPEFFPATHANAGDMDAQMFGSSPVGGSQSMHLMILLALTAADIAKSKRMVLRRWARRSTTRRIYENLALLVRSQL